MALDWYQVSSFLQLQGLSYLDSELLLLEHGSGFGLKKSEVGFYIKCHNFMAWIQENLELVVSFQGKGRRKFGSSIEIDKYLAKKGA